MLHALAQNTSARQAQSEIFFWLIVLVVTAIVLALMAWLLRRWLAPGSGDAGRVASHGFSLAQLQRLHDQGELSDDEFENAKKLIIARTRAAMEANDSDR